MILVIGLDGYPWAWEGRLREAGYHTAPMYSPHAQSAPAWNSLMSGLRAESHRFEGLPVAGVRDTGDRVRYVWDHVLAAGKQTIAVGVPFVWPPMLMRLHVCGYPAPPENYTYPRHAQQDWPFGSIDITNAYRSLAPWDFRAVPNDELVATARRGRHDMAHRLRAALEPGLPDLLIACWTDIDRLSHVAYAAMQDPQIRESVVDELIGIADRLSSIYHPTWTFIVSDHGLDFSQEPPTMHPTDDFRQTHGPDMPETQHGIFAYRAQGAAAIPEGQEVQLEDLVPTLLYLLDAPPVGRIDGRALTEIIGDETVDEAATRARIEQLGYI